MFKKYIYVLAFVFLIWPNVLQAQTVDLESLLTEAYESNALIKSVEHRLDSEESLVSSSYTLEDPMIGISSLDRGSKTRYGVISQKIRFPVKYYLQGKVQKFKAKSIKSELIGRRFEIRKQVITLYYSLFSLQKTIQLTQANMQAVRDFSRVAERKYAAGKATQSDSMKAHVELTRLELELIRYKQNEQALNARLAAILNNPNLSNLKFLGKELKVPKFKSLVLDAPAKVIKAVVKSNSPELEKEEYLLNAAETASDLAKWEFAPDIQLQYQERLSGQPEESRIYSVSLSFPMWFWKKGAESSAANSMKLAQSFKLQSKTDLLMAKVIDLKGRVEVGEKTLKIFKTSLIPQALGAYNSSKASYRANKTSFLDLLDSERSLFKIRTSFYGALKDFVSDLVELESELGLVVSDLERGAL